MEIKMEIPLEGVITSTLHWRDSKDIVKCAEDLKTKIRGCCTAQTLERTWILPIQNISQTSLLYLQ